MKISNLNRLTQLTLTNSLILLLSLVLSSGCSDSENSGGITGTGSPLESYIKEGFVYHNEPSGEESGNESPSFVDPAIDSDQISNEINADDDFSTTNLQEAGVDEADWVKTDGEFAYSYSGPNIVYYSDVIAVETPPALTRSMQTPNFQTHHQLNIFDLNTATGKQAPINSLPLDESLGQVEGLYLEKEQDQLLLLANKYSYDYDSYFWHWSTSTAQIRSINIQDPRQHLEQTASIDIDGQYVSSRKIGDTLYIVTQYTPRIEGFIQSPSNTDEVANNLILINKTSLADLLPKIHINGQHQALLQEQDCTIPETMETNDQPTLAIVTAINVKNFSDFKASCIASPIDTIYVSSNTVYLLNDQYSEQRSHIYQIDISTGNPRYQTTTSVEGLIGWDNPFRLSEYQNHLRLITSKNLVHQLHILKMEEDALLHIASLPNSDKPASIGKTGEDIYAVRFMGNRAYVVTFRNTDPFYAIDLSNPSQPKILGELEIPGFSTYLHPFGDDLVFGIGREANWNSGIKLALFDVSDTSNPVVKKEIILGSSGSHSSAIYNHKAVTLLSKNNGQQWQVGIPVSLYSNNYHWSHDGFYLLEIDLQAEQPDNSMQEHGILTTLENESSNYSQLSSYDRGIFKSDKVHFVYDKHLWTQSW